jgi:hypothetical protein
LVDINPDVKPVASLAMRRNVTRRIAHAVGPACSSA